jgi:hypothetical protein
MARPLGDYHCEARSGAKVGDAAYLLIAELYWGWLLRSKPFLEVLGRAEQTGRRSKHPRARVAIDAGAARAVRASRGVSLVLRSMDRCLVRGLALHAVCRRRGIASRLVLGVRTEPFAAHCWVELDRQVIVGEFEQARLYTPILAIG